MRLVLLALRPRSGKQLSENVLYQGCIYKKLLKGCLKNVWINS